MNEFNKEIGQRIWNLRMSKGLTREKLSEMSDISAKFLYEVEIGKKGISAMVLSRISKSLEADCNFLLYGEINTENFAYIKNLLLTLDSEQIKCAEKILYYFCKSCKENKT